MKNFTFNQTNGEISIDGKKFGSDTNFFDFDRFFSEKTQLIFGKDGTGQYSLVELVNFLGEDFRTYFRFKNNLLQCLTIKLVSGVAKNRKEDYPDYAELQKEVEYIYEIYRNKFYGQYSSEYEWKRIWLYGWGSVVLSQEAHSSQVVTDFAWS